ncbi:hypothetical protein OE09_0367 [Flavobacteriaceae bacterium MAR_2010_72]|nr:hypothetical protein OE09_0367 [Flavobacteriaceae bacterium MAR_2010_72]TVZ57923.1 hypothetical protein NA63_0414 [Flavobacteriaceae bacterium MAR_2010_105]
MKINNIKNKILCSFVLFTFVGFAQETVNGSDINSFIIGGGQETTPATLFLNDVAIVDVSPEGQAVIADGESLLLEAGLPILAGGTSDFVPDIWINYTYRPANPLDQAEIFIRTSQPLPAGVTLNAKVIEKSVGGNFDDRGVKKDLSVDETNSKIVRTFGAGYTDDGVTNGYKIQYTYSNTGSEELPPGFAIIYEIIIK